MSTFGTMISRITREMRRDNLTADIKDQIASAIDHYREKRFWFNEGEATAQTTTGIAVYAFPTKFIELDNVILEDTAGYRYPLKPEHWSVVDNEDTVNNSFPCSYASFSEQIYLRPPPDRILTIKVSGLKDLTEVSASAADNATNAWMVEGETLIRSRAKSQLFLHKLRNEQQAAAMRVAETDAFNSLSGHTVRKTTTGRVKKTQF